MRTLLLLLALCASLSAQATGSETVPRGQVAGSDSVGSLPKHVEIVVTEIEGLTTLSFTWKGVQVSIVGDVFFLAGAGPLPLSLLGGLPGAQQPATAGTTICFSYPLDWEGGDQGPAFQDEQSFSSGEKPCLEAAAASVRQQAEQYMEDTGGVPCP